MAWQLALQRAAGRLTEAHAAAIDAGEPMLAATMAMLAGNPVPWFEHNNANLAGVKQTADTYTPLALKRWQGKAILRTDLDPTFKLLNSRNQATRALAFNSLFLLGASAAAEAALTKSTPLEAFAYFEALERIPEALAALGLDPQQPDYAAWVATRVERLIKEPDDSDQATIALATIASFLENRGLQEDLANAFDKPLAHLAQKDVNAFTNFLGALFGEHSVRTGIVGPLMRVGTEWAGDDDARWDELVVAAFGDNEENLTCWKWLAELKPQATRKQRLAAMFALSGYGADPDHLRDTWLALAWAAITKAEPARRPLLCKHLSALIGRNVDVANSLKIHDMNPPLAPGDELDGLYLLDLSAAGRWDEASRIFLKLFSSKDKLTENTRPDLHAYAATCLRRAGHPDEAAVHDVWVEKLALGDAATYLRIAHGYAFGGDYDRCSLWRERAAREAEPDNEEYSNMLTVHAADLLRRGQWKPAAATAEALAQIYSGSNFGSDSTLSLLRMRLQADLCHALSLLETDRARALAMLEKCHGLLPCDGALADHFFPALRKAGLVKQHDAWFEITWNLIQAVVKRYPDSHNTRNTAAWLACRALRHLDEAAAHLNKVLATHPYQAAYLDTMAELQFARGNRQQAIEWSDKAINFMPGDDDIRRQHHRFVNDPFPE
jgi:tetratricopeptide (TPR) repeat protein